MSHWIFSPSLSALAVCVGLMPGICRGQIFADFHTSHGSFTCRLEHVVAPQTVANFIGLATGQRAWLDLPSGQVRTNRFYDGLTFHRVIRNFMIQDGSRNGMGTDGPGYVFPDEFNPNYRHEPGTLSSANSGPDSNGSQFFVTVTNTSWLDGVHTVFGRVVDGMSVVRAISEVPTVQERPLTPVVIERVDIRRVGIEAENFNIHAQGLPIVLPGTLGIQNAGKQSTLSYTNRLYTHQRLYESTNLVNWTARADLGIDLRQPVMSSTTVSNQGAMRFFKVVETRYPSSTLAPRTLRQRALSLAFTGGGALAIQFDNAGTGTYTYNGSPGTVVGYDYYQEPYRARLWPIYFSNVLPMTLNLNFVTEASGSFSGTAHTTNQIPVSGTFTLGGK